MIWQAVDDAVFGETVEGLLAQLAVAPTKGLVAARRAIHASSSNALEAQLDLERDLQRELGYGEDYREGVAAFVEKRAPRFTGK
jgi:2-(1,2-epoxy-1,2-dihydrophenyl)acetyl-CoA isomerase